MKRTAWTAGITAAAVLAMSAAGIPAYAAETEQQSSVDTGNYSYLAGQQRSMKRNAIYEQAEKIEDEDARKAFLIENGIADTAYSEEAAASYSYVIGRERGASYHQ